MTAFAILLRRELLRYRGLFVAALAMGLFAVLVPSYAAAGAATVGERRGVAAVGLAALWSLVVAAGLGATSLSRARGARPLGFDLRLPASTAAIWGARTLAAYLAALGTGALVVALVLPFGADLALAAEALDGFVHGALPRSAWFEGLLAFSPLLVAAVLLVAQAAELAISGDRTLAAVDLVAILVAKGSVWLAFRELLASSATGGVRRLVLGALVAALAVLLAASWRQVARGRDERRAAHRAATPVLVAGAVLIAVAAPLFARWYLNPSPSAVVRLDAVVQEQDLGDGWRALSGPASGREHHLRFTWLLHDAPERAILIDRGDRWFYSFRDFLQRAKTAPRVAWIAHDPTAGPTLRYLDLDDPIAAPRDAGMRLGGPSPWRLADDGESIEVLPGPERLPLPPRPAKPSAGSGTS